MPYKEKVIEKVYWDIGEVAKLVNQATSAVRFWEGEFSWLKPRRKNNGDRQYSQRDLLHLQRIKYLLIECGMTLDGVRKAKKENYLEWLVLFFRQAQGTHLDNLKAAESVIIA